MKSITLTIVLLAIGCEAIKLQTSTKWGLPSLPAIIPKIEIPKIDVATLTDPDALKALATDEASKAAGVDVTPLTDPDAV